MKKIFVIIVLFCLFVSCFDKRSNTITFLFEPEQASSIRDSLIKLRDIAEEYFIMQKKEDPHSSSIALTSDRYLWIDGKFCKWSNLEKNKESVFQANLEMNLYYLDEKGFFPLFKFLNDNYIGAIYYYLEGASYFHYGGEPFFGEPFIKHIVLKSDFYAMPKVERDYKLTYYLITDDKEGMLLLTRKSDIFLLLYGAWGDNLEEKVPAKWLKPTDEVFYK